MGSELDPKGAETRAVLRAADFRDARVLEIGCGDGRVTFRYAGESRSVVGIDQKEVNLAPAVSGCPRNLRERVRFVCASAARLPFRDERFEIVLFALSL
jgi:ubiquinone/menaquinone biosynthesis C-methylase UbiE